MSPTTESIRSRFAALMGDGRAVSDPETCRRAAVDGSVPTTVLYPETAEQAAAALKVAAEHGWAVIPFRNATKLSIGNPPRRYEVALSLESMNQVRHYDPDDLTVSVEPGMLLGDFQSLLAKNHLWLPVDPSGGVDASLGGILAAGASGPLRLRYGGPRDMVIGMKVATTDGKVVKTGGRVVKNVAGYDLAKLLIGSYGTLGVIVEASFRLYPLPPQRETFVFKAESLDSARELRRKIAGSQLQPLRMVLLDGVAALRVRDDRTSPDAAPWAAFEIWIEAAGSSAVLGRYAREFEALGREAGARLERPESDRALRLWNRISDFSRFAAESFQGAAVFKVAMPLAATEDLLRDAVREAGEPDTWLGGVMQSGVGVGHLAVKTPSNLEQAAGSIARLRRAAVNAGGALVVERCPADVKRHVDVWGAAGDDFEVMRKVKAAWDPKEVLSPGRGIGGI